MEYVNRGVLTGHRDGIKGQAGAVLLIVVALSITTCAVTDS